MKTMKSKGEKGGNEKERDDGQRHTREGGNEKEER